MRVVDGSCIGVELNDVSPQLAGELLERSLQRLRAAVELSTCCPYYDLTATQGENAGFSSHPFDQGDRLPLDNRRTVNGQGQFARWAGERWDPLGTLSFVLPVSQT
jgi:hypothetical protein